MINCKLFNITRFNFHKLLLISKTLSGKLPNYFYFRANENVRKVFSCAFMGRRAATELARQQLIDKVKSNKLDYTSCEVQSKILIIA